MNRFPPPAPDTRRRPPWVGAGIVIGVLALCLVGALPAFHGPAAASDHRAFVPAALTVPPLTTNTSTLDLGMPLNASVNASAIMGGSGNATNLTFTWSGLPTNCTSQNVSNYTCYPTQTGRFSIGVTVTDFSDQQSGTATAVAITVNSDPTVASISASASTVSVNQMVTFTVSASGGTPPLIYVYSGLPAGCSGNRSTVTCAPTTVQAYNVSVTVSDGVNFTSNSAYVVVRVNSGATSSSTPRLTAADWGIIAGILVLGFALAGYLWVRARREERAARPPPPRAWPPPPTAPPPEAAPASGPSVPPGR